MSRAESASCFGGSVFFSWRGWRKCQFVLRWSQQLGWIGCLLFTSAHWLGRSSESIKSANKPGDVFIPSHSADSVALGKTSEDLSTWHCWPIYLYRLPRDRLSPVFFKPAGSPPSEGPLCFTAANHLAKYFSHMWSVYMCTYSRDCGKKVGPAEGKREVCLRDRDGVLSAV